MRHRGGRERLGERARVLGVSSQDLANFLQSSLSGVPVTYYRERDQLFWMLTSSGVLLITSWLVLSLAVLLSVCWPQAAKPKAKAAASKVGRHFFTEYSS